MKYFKITILLLLLIFSNSALKAANTNTTFPDTTDWMPLEVGNKWQYDSYTITSIQPGSFLTWFEFKNTEVVDTIIINNHKYYVINDFFDFPSYTKIRYVKSTSQIRVFKNEADYVFMDFTLSDGDTLLQIKANGSLKEVIIIESLKNILGDEIIVKGFYDVEPSTVDQEGYYYFARGLGYVYQKEYTNWLPIDRTDLKIIEYQLLKSSSDTLHKKHSYNANIQFDPIFFLPLSNKINQEFPISHHYSVLSFPPAQQGRTYIDSAFLESYYSNESDTIFNPIYQINPIDEIDFNLDYEIDTTLYNQGYHLYYRIAAKDKGIISDTYYKPDSGYYKLYWKDSSSTFVQTEFNELDYSLFQNYPNPFNPQTKIEFTIPEKQFISLTVYDALGNEIRKLINEELTPGKYEVNFDAGGLSSGVYFYQLRTKSYLKTNKMIYLK